MGTHVDGHTCMNYIHSNQCNGYRLYRMHVKDMLITASIIVLFFVIHVHVVQCTLQTVFMKIVSDGLPDDMPGIHFSYM